ncbi:hypothetical protein C1H46_028916 [Malus baccata]|uniref:Uncharacterized protein n=1 Tax=Malus baccata TaxID=106549 RepID=A0A540LGB1_MALBA|nr:hypothetical protein C1H46_028916 [Malus baccata]
MSTPTRKRLMRDFKRLQQNPPARINGVPQDGNVMLSTRLVIFEAPVRRCDYGIEVQGRRGRERPRKTLEETLRKDLRVLRSNRGHGTEPSAMAF